MAGNAIPIMPDRSEQSTTLEQEAARGADREVELANTASGPRVRSTGRVLWG